MVYKGYGGEVGADVLLTLSANCTLQMVVICIVDLGRFVRFVSTPEVLERVTTIEAEILQIVDAIAIQSNDTLGLRSVSQLLQLIRN